MKGMPEEDTNRNTYESRSLASSYASDAALQKPEQTILDLMRDTLRGKSMLDIGVGGGRTTLHFAPLVKEYVGVDYTESMIAACKKRFERFPAYTFLTADARSMRMFPDARFDFILFSYNGLDYVSHEDRMAILREVRRVGRPGGTFCFSSHNLNASQVFSLQFSFNPIVLLRRAVIYAGIRLANRGILGTVHEKDHAIVNDGAKRFGLHTYYVRPQEQVRQLKDAGFSAVRLYSLDTGREIGPSVPMSGIKDAWVYYLCDL